jgi:hypothetical protein
MLKDGLKTEVSGCQVLGLEELPSVTHVAGQEEHFTLRMRLIMSSVSYREMNALCM